MSILNTDLSELYDQWGERVAFNEGYKKQKLMEATQAGRDAFHLGIDRSQGREFYFDAKDQRFSEAREFLSGEINAVGNSDISDVEPEVVAIEPVGDITDGEETLGMESVVANETEYQRATVEDWSVYGNDPEFMEDPDEYMRGVQRSEDRVAGSLDPFADYAGEYGIDLDTQEGVDVAWLLSDPVTHGLAEDYGIQI